MTSPLQQQKRLLEEKITILQRLDDGLRWSLDRLPQLGKNTIDDPAVSERISAIVDRFCKLQDQLAGSLRHAHAMLGEKHRSFHDVIRWAVSQDILADPDAWLELRTLRNRLTHEYDLHSERLPELVALIEQSSGTLSTAVERFARLSAQLGLTGNRGDPTADR